MAKNPVRRIVAVVGLLFVIQQAGHKFYSFEQRTTGLYETVH
jgi:hypothetical protein